MLLSMVMINEELSKSFQIPAASFSDDLHHAGLKGAAVLTSDPPEPQVVYVAEARRLPVRWKETVHRTLVIAGAVDPSYFAQADVEYLCVNDTRLANVLNAVLHIFQTYNEFDEMLRRQILQGESPESFCACVARFVDNPVIVFDSALRLQYISPDAEHLLDWELDAFSGLRVLPTEFINQLNLVYIETANNFINGAVLLRDDRLSNNLICTLNGKNAYIIAVFEVRSKLSKSTLELVSYINQYLLAVFESNQQKKPNSGGLAPFIISMLSGSKFGNEDMNSCLSSVGWKPDDSCCCIVIRTLKDQHAAKYSNTFCLKLENLFSACVAFPYQEWAVAIVNLDKSGGSIYDIPHTISILLRDGLLKAGISFKYWSFDTTPIYYQQACSAYEFGKIYNPTNWCYIFEDYALYYFMHYGSSRIPPRHLCHPGLVQLYRYDRKNGTELLHTLETYVKSNCNAVTAANALFIHRNTFYQRLNRIQEMLNLDLENERVRLYLQLSACLIEMYYYELNNGYTVQ